MSAYYTALSESPKGEILKELMRVRDERDAALKEVERLREIVDRLPKTADGVPITDGGEYHFGVSNGLSKMFARMTPQFDPSTPSRFWARCYSTEAAALAAKEGR